MGETVNYVGKRSISTEPLNPASATWADVNIKLVSRFYKFENESGYILWSDCMFIISKVKLQVKGCMENNFSFYQLGVK